MANHFHEVYDIYIYFCSLKRHYVNTHLLDAHDLSYRFLNNFVNTYNFVNTILNIYIYIYIYIYLSVYTIRLWGGVIHRSRIIQYSEDS